MSDGATPVIALAGVRVAHGARAVLDVPALAVQAGETLGVMGPNGAGKSTLLRVLGLLEPPATGTVRFRGEVVTPAQGLPVRRRMASVFQEPLLADATVFDNAAMGLRFRGVPRADARPRVQGWLERFGIGALGDRQARTLSGGEAQRVALARALVVEPELLLLDEPFATLDQPTRESLIQDLRGVLRADRVTTVLVTHHRGEALALGDRLAVLIGGRILQVGPAAQVFQAPDSEEVARFVGLETILAGRVRERRDGRILVDAEGHAFEVAAAGEPGERVQLALRPEDVRLAGAGAVPGAANCLTGRVAHVVPAPLHVRVVVDCGMPVVAVVTHRIAADLALVPGMAVTVSFAPESPHVLRSSGAPPRAAPSLDTVTGVGV
ncbi:MAG TPA: ABC transporter ATP-binding protein [Pseudomonadales bacterium]|nr:ABC transporter ATP-binding protein [Pseudomonadales bacterium]